MKLIIEDDEGRKTVVPVVRDEITIGRQDGNTIKLTERNVSRRHARLWKSDGSLLIEDLGSYNGIRVNGDKIEGPTTIREGDLVEIGDYDLGIQGKIEATAPAKPAAPAPKAPQPKTTPVPAPSSAAGPIQTPPMASAPVPAAAPSPMQEMSSSASAGGATAIININQLMGMAPQVEVRDLPKSEMPRLVGLAGAFRGKEFYLMKTEWKIGRTEENDASLDHQSISRQHCKFIFDGSDWKIYDNKSANGVKVNGDLYGVATVKPGDTVELGHVKFRFCAPGEKFTPPPEKVEGQPPMGGKPPPTTAELIAAASGHGPSAKPAAAAKSNIGLVVGIIIALVVVAGIAYGVMNKKGGSTDENGNPTGEAALKAAHAAADKKDFIKASELAESAGTAAPASFKKKMSDESQAQQAYQRFDAALASNDPDKAKIELDRCASEDTYFCGKVKEREDEFKKSFAKKHLFLAMNAKGTNPALCTEETGKVLALEPGNAEAQALSQQCSPAQVVAPVAPRPATPAGPTQKDRDNQASDKLTKAITEFRGGDPTTAQQDLLACVNLKPNNAVLGRCYRTLGVINSTAGNRPEAVKWFKKYLPICVPEECDKVKTLIEGSGG